MNMFLDECGYKVTVHDNQTMWFEVAVANAGKRTGNLQVALRQYRWIESHVEKQLASQYDYYLFFLRKFSMNSFEKMIEMFDNNLFFNKCVI